MRRRGAALIQPHAQRDAQPADHKAQALAPSVNRSLPRGHESLRGAREGIGAVEGLARHAQTLRAELLQQPRQVPSVHRRDSRRAERGDLTAGESRDVERSRWECHGEGTQDGEGGAVLQEGW